jgi:hypothetical protein
MAEFKNKLSSEWPGFGEQRIGFGSSFLGSGFDPA